MLTWDNPIIAPEQDPIILSGLRALSLWVREDDNSQLNKQTMGMADMLAALYESSVKEDAKTDFRHPILVLLEGLLPNSDEAVRPFRANITYTIEVSDVSGAFHELLSCLKNFLGPMLLDYMCGY
jgi:hypothetical protein